MIEGEGASTTVEGEKMPMHPGDLMLTPNWLWYEHRNEGERDVLWLDGLDSLFVFAMAAAVYESYEKGFLEETRPEDNTHRAYGLGTILPIAYEAPAEGSPLLIYCWENIEPALDRLAELDTSTPYDGVAIEYVNPADAGHTMSTMSCWMQMMRPGEQTMAHRHTYAPVYHVFRGHGHTIIDGRRFDWGPGDSFIEPLWAWHEHANDSTDEPTYLFSINDLLLHQRPAGAGVVRPQPRRGARRRRWAPESPALGLKKGPACGRLLPRRR